jgi:hypothetical protein
MISAKSDSGEEVEHVKVYRQTDGKTDGQRAIRKAHLRPKIKID